MTGIMDKYFHLNIEDSLDITYQWKLVSKIKPCKIKAVRPPVRGCFVERLQNIAQQLPSFRKRKHRVILTNQVNLNS